MREYELVEKTLKDFEPKSVTCNMCGKSEELHGEDYEREWQAEKFQPFSCSFGYGSKFDMEEWKFDLCEDCLDELVNTFKFKPEGYGE